MATNFLLGPNDVYPLKPDHRSWVVSTSFEGLNLLKDNIQKVNYYELLWTLGTMTQADTSLSNFCRSGRIILVRQTIYGRLMVTDLEIVCLGFVSLAHRQVPIKPNPMATSRQIPSVNFHLIKPCNMGCKYCFARFNDVDNQKLRRAVPTGQAPCTSWMPWPTSASGRSPSPAGSLRSIHT